MMRSVCVPFLSGPASTASSFVALTCSYVLGSFFSTELCHDQFTARHMMAPSASEDLRDFVCNPSLPRFLSHIQNGHLYSYPALAAEWDCVPAFASPIPGYCLEEKSLSRHHLAVAISRRYRNSFSAACYSQHNSGYLPAPTCEHACRCERRKGKSSEAFWKHQAQSALILFRDPEKLGSLPEWEGTIDKCCSTQLQYVCAPACFLMGPWHHTRQTWLGTHGNIKAPFSSSSRRAFAFCGKHILNRLSFQFSQRTWSKVLNSWPNIPKKQEHRRNVQLNNSSQCYMYHADQAKIFYHHSAFVCWLVTLPPAKLW